MKTPSPAKIILLAMTAAALLCAQACSDKAQEPAPQVASPAPNPLPAVAPAPAVTAGSGPKSAMPNSFYQVMNRLDRGGGVYGYLSSEQLLDGLSGRVGELKTSLVDNFPIPAEERAMVDKGFEVAIRLIRNSGLEEISGVGLSGFALEQDLHRTKVLIHHYPGKNKGFVWSMFGKSPGALEGLKLLPKNTVLAGSSNLNFPGLLALIESEFKASGIPDADASIAQAKLLFSMGSGGLQYDGFVATLGGEYGFVLTLDESVMVQIPGPQPVSIPRPDILLFMKVNDDLLYNQAITMAKAQKMPIEESDKDGVKSAAMPIPLPIGAQYKVTLAAADGLLLLGTSQEIVRDALASRAGTSPGLTSTPEFKRISRDVPMTANSFSYVNETFGRVYMDTQMKAMAMGQPGSPAVTTAMRKAMEVFSKPSASFGVFQNTEEGWLWTGNSTTPSSATLVAAAVVAPVGLLAAIAIPNFVKARETAQRNSCIANLRQIDGAKQQWAIENKRKASDQPRPDELYGASLYIKLQPTCPSGGTYSINAVSKDPACSHPGHSIR